ncbi:MAG: S1/P1 Nuclease [Caulobacteraceae bacterium]|nr:MAG: S1/P1 Nuclease [Caulobacteraceae bacterium]
MFAALAAAGLVGALAVTQALAWGASGHRLVGQLAVEALPAEIPAFLRGRKAIAAMGELAREPDRWKGGGKLHDSDREGAHFVDIDDAGLVMGVMPLADLKATRADYEKALQTAGTDGWKAGWLQYSIIDGYNQLIVDFRYWRVLTVMEKRAKGPQRAWYRADRLRREQLILRDMGEFAHYVGDGSQPLHTSIHYNGWGDFPNPKGYTNDRIHSVFEGEFVARSVTLAGARAAMPPARDCACSIEQRTVAYLSKTNTQTEPLYAMMTEGAFKANDPRAVTFTTRLVGEGSAELRDMIVMAWRESATGKIGWPAVAVEDVVAGKTDPWVSLLGKD